ncbi:chymotrypsinogen B-like [Pocillopora damicornis]|uniref:chymotrypsinogen B-like n=1 Tax=Pocillopora damicornis TaxID=46731 RepID=UPI000F557BDB|nr:chymotrypsinogen B-like [Pocillopora damicornis]
MNLWIGAALLLLGVSHSKGCGVKPYTARVVNGENASPHSWPWQISLRVNGRHICGGSLIDKDWVVTAAHCVDRNPNPSGYTVVVGAHSRLGSTTVQRTHRLKKLFKHEGYSGRHLRNDIALLQLERPITASSKVNTVCLPESRSRIPAGTQCYITGWGRTVGGGSAANILQQARLPVASHSDCSRINGRLLPVDDTSMICAGGQGKGGCQGDSGGPFVCAEKGRWVLRGAVSWGHRMCRTDHYTVFARLSSFIEWINRKKSGTSGGGSVSCVDGHSYCPHWTKYCSWHSWVKATCKKTCKRC